jgi:Eukaryotic aspartyl protease
MTIGGHKSDEYSAPDTDIISHSVSGSFHWSISLVRYKIGDKWFKPNGLQALTDTGTSYILLSSGKGFSCLKDFNR